MTRSGATSYAPGGTQLPAPGGKYPAPTPHAATAEQKPFQAPTSPDGVGLKEQGFQATDNPTITNVPGGKGVATPEGQAAAQAAFNACT